MRENLESEMRQNGARGCTRDETEGRVPAKESFLQAWNQSFKQRVTFVTPVKPPDSKAWNTTESGHQKIWGLWLMQGVWPWRLCQGYFFWVSPSSGGTPDFSGGLPLTNR